MNLQNHKICPPKIGINPLGSIIDCMHAIIINVEYPCIVLLIQILYIMKPQMYIYNKGYSI